MPAHRRPTGVRMRRRTPPRVAIRFHRRLARLEAAHALHPVCQARSATETYEISFGTNDFGSGKCMHAHKKALRGLLSIPAEHTHGAHGAPRWCIFV